jgi:gliding motility-associated lipoprotein GldD
MIKINSIIILISICLVSCGGNDKYKVTVPQSKKYPEPKLPAHKYKAYQSNCGYHFKSPEIFTIKDVKDDKGNLTCHKDIDLGALNGIIHFSYIPMVEKLSTYVNYANDKVDEHKIKAIAIKDQQIIKPESKVFGTFFELQGDVAAPFQFYLTDSTHHFVSGVVYFNCRPNYDSLKPSIEYLKKDLLEIVNSFEWN